MLMTFPISVLIVDDQALVRRGVRAFLESQPNLTVCGEADSGQAAIQLAGELAPDVVLMDLMMPGMDGVEATRQIKHVSPRSQIIILTSYHEDEHIFPAIRAGALSYLLKDVRPEELAEAVQKAAAGEAILNPRVAARLVLEVQGRKPEPANVFTELSERELGVLRLVANGLSNAEIAVSLFIGEKTVKSHVSNILAKLHLADRTQAAVLAWREGLLRPGDQ
jgi:two-component system, NarL family, response regulator LiaR